MARKLLILALATFVIAGFVSADSSSAPNPSSGAVAPPPTSGAGSEIGDSLPLPEADSDDTIGNTDEAAAGPGGDNVVEGPVGGPVSVEQAFGPIAAGPSSGVAAIEASAIAGVAGAAAVAGFFFF